LFGFEEITMSVKHDFAKVNYCGINLAPPHSEELWADWLVAVASGCDQGIFEQTNIDGMVTHIQERHGINAAHLLHGCEGEYLCVLNPDNDAAIAMAVSMVPDFHAGFHFDLVLYRKALTEAVDDYWDDMTIPDRIEFLQRHHSPVSGALGSRPPDLMRGVLEEMLDGVTGL
jgi:hypothetical protein